MTRWSKESQREAALRDYAAGVTGPVVCQRYGISERTLYRWNRADARARAEAGVGARGEAAGREDLHRAALEVVAGLLPRALRERAERALQQELRITRSQARRMLEPAAAPEGADRVGVPLARRHLEAPVADEFGKAPWLAVVELAGSVRFVRNTGQSGVWAATALRDAGCREVVVAHVGARAGAQLERHGLRVWRAAAGRTARDQIAALRRGELEAWPTGLVTLGAPKR
jgi:predicted Fe-Mo cluster-binding NifX family protein